MNNHAVSRVLIVDDHPLFRQGASQLFELDNRFHLVGEATSGSKGLELATKLQPDLVLLDLNMEDFDGIQTLKAMRAAGITSKIVMLTVSNAAKDLMAAMRDGADGYLLKDMEPEDILDLLCDAVMGKKALNQEMTTLLVQSLNETDPARQVEDAAMTEREKEILGLIATGLNNKLIARELGITEGTVKVHVKNILRKLNLTSRLEAALWAIDHDFKH